MTLQGLKGQHTWAKILPKKPVLKARSPDASSRVQGELNTTARVSENVRAQSHVLFFLRKWQGIELIKSSAATPRPAEVRGAPSHQT